MTTDTQRKPVAVIVGVKKSGRTTKSFIRIENRSSEATDQKTILRIRNSIEQRVDTAQVVSTQPGVAHQ